MSRFVVDASVAIKWYLPEPHDDCAARLRREGTDLDAPDLLHAEILVKGGDARLPADLLPLIRAIPGVMDADGFRALRLRDGQGAQFLVGAGDFDVMARRGRLPFRRGDSVRILDARARDGVIVTETFAERYGLVEGDEVRLQPPGGEARFRIAGVYYDYTTEGGLVVMDRRLFQRLWSDAWLNSVVLYLAPGAEAATVRKAVRTATDREDLVNFSNRDLRRRVLDIFDQTFAITYALQAIALIVAALGVLTTLAASVLERTREIGILRSLGFGRAGIARTVLAEAGLLGILANVVGVLAGVLRHGAGIPRTPGLDRWHSAANHCGPGPQGQSQPRPATPLRFAQSPRTPAD